MKKIFACFVTFLLLSMLLITPVKADSCWELYFMFETENGRVCPWDEEDKLNNIKVKNGETVSAIVQADDFYTIQKTEVIVDGKLLDIESVRENMEGHDDVFYLHHRYVATGEQGSEHEVTITWYATSKREDENSNSFTFKYTIDGKVENAESGNQPEKAGDTKGDAKNSEESSSGKPSPIIPLAVAGGVVVVGGLGFAGVKSFIRKTK